MSETIRDVNLRPNWAVVHEFLKRDGAEFTEQLLAKMPVEISRRCKDMSKVLDSKRFHFRYPDTWEPLSTWNIIERALIDVLGHGYHLKEVGRHSRFAAFGVDVLKAGFVGSPIGRMITSPAVGCKNVGFVAANCVRNKDIGFVETGHTEGVFVMKHHRKVCNPLDDFWSLSSFIPGFGDAVNLFWRQEIDPRAQTTVLAVSVLSVLNHHAPYLDAYIDNGLLYVDGVEHGEVLYMRKHESGYFLNVDYALALRQEESVAAVHITKDILTPCMRCHTDGNAVLHPILTKGTMLQFSDNPEHQFVNSAFSAFWQKKWVDVFRRVSSKVVMKRTYKQLQIEEKLTEANRELMSKKEFLARRMPSRKIADELADGKLQAFEIDLVVVQSDTVGFTNMVEQLGLSATEQRKLVGGKVMNEFRIAQKHGGWAYKAIGDCSVIPFSSQWPRYEYEKRLCLTMEIAAKNALRSAELMHQASVAKGIQARIGIHVDSSSWSDISVEGLDDGWVDWELDEKEMFEGGGDAFNKAARLEKLAPPGGTSVSEQVLRLAFGDRLVNMVKESQQAGDGNMLLPGRFRYAGNKEVKGGTIEVWTNDLNHLETEVSGIDFDTIFDELEMAPGAKPAALNLLGDKDNQEDI